MFVVDRGSRDCVGVMHALGLHVAMPPFLRKQKQFTTIEANKSRLITKIRSVVEMVNAQLKQFKLFSQTFQSSSIKDLKNYLSIACALINCHKSEVLKSKPEDIESSKEMLELVNKPNLVQLLLNESNLLFSNWTTLNATEFLEFLILAENQTRKLTFGPIGSRVVGCCSHDASAIWFLGFKGWQSHQRVQPSGSHLLHASDSMQITGFEDDDEDNQTRYRLA
ncbi:unnamed protein product [Didymodactylos carnosus]|uniref:DDE Tnp4 domain-containing protein n=1 Tax=Didymodactylos carnosus TaxID=1234261 RepID=A0A814XM62_9BILA|nr:unnamed protein product [Didymodactylos carnosus]CAF1399398.1 unnamed protein product [Didymodactylos carnosus]CAF3979875.1 unnamed protein product [Didymodactylos carnosus]CAF4206714.1 unnamed protein product [Didymodactylos carnosus]